MDQFVNQDVFQTLYRLLGQLGVQADCARRMVAAPPLRLHPLDEEPLHAHAQLTLPSTKQRRYSLLQLLSIPLLDKRPFLVLRRLRSHLQKHTAVLQRSAEETLLREEVLTFREAERLISRR